MANTQSIKKISKFLEEEDEIKTASDVAFGVGLSSKTTHEVLNLLESFGVVTLMSNGKVTLVKFIKKPGDTNAD